MSDIEQILYPTILTSLREDIPPVKCIIWKGGDSYETIQFDKVYPFDTIEDIKRMICVHYEKDSNFIPKFVFLGVPIGDAAYSDEVPSLSTQYLAADYLWYPTGTNDARNTYVLSNPRKALITADLRFITSDGSYASPNYEPRGRSTIETVFLKPRDGRIPVFHVFTLNYLLREYQGQKPISEEDWNKRFAPYFPNIPIDGPYEPDMDDIQFSKKINTFIKQRESTLEVLNGFLEGGYELPTLKVSGIRQLRLVWNKPVKGFEGSGYIFYRIPVTETRPFLRLLPAEGSAITKLHVKGVLPIPTLDDPRVLEIWGKETTPTPGSDYTYFKYVHRPSIGITQPIYGTVRILNDGTMDLLLQPPKGINKLDPILDFRNFSSTLNEIFEGLPQDSDNFKIGEMATVFTMKTNIKSKKFTRTRLLQRLPLFQAVFQEISPLPNQSPILSIRYKAVNQYVTEDKTFSFLTQYATAKILEGETAEYEMINALQNEFQISKSEASEIVTKWFDQRGTFTLALPEDGEFMESFNPGIDIHIYSQHPSYYFHVNRIDSYDTYTRVFSLLSLLFIEDDEYFSGVQQLGNTLSTVSYDIEQQDIAEEERGVQELVSTRLEDINEGNDKQTDQNKVDNITAANASSQNQLTPENATANTIPDYLMDMMMNPMNTVNELNVQPENAPNPISELTESKSEIDQQIIKRKRPPIASTTKIIKELPDVDDIENQNFNNENMLESNKYISKPKIGQISKDEEEEKLINPKSWFIKKLQEIDPRLFDYTANNPKDSYSRKCQDVDDRQPAVLTKDQYEKMREIYEDDNIFFIVYPLDGTTEPIQPLGTEETYTLMRYGSSTDDINYYFCPKYYCLSDEIMIRPKDFESTRDREGNPKPPNTCPFCKGKLITNKKKAEIGYTVIRRKDKKNSIHPHTQIDFLSKSSHPENFSLPCCFLKHKTLRISDSDFAHIRDYLQEKDLARLNANELSEEIDEEELETLDAKDENAIEYQVLFETINKRYILESNKNPDPGIFAISSIDFDKFFTQDSGNTLVKRVGISLKLLPNAQGFLRIGTENTITESLFGVLAPIIYKNSINEVRERILEVVSPRVFVYSHFGNLVLEFYNPSDSSAMPQTEQELKAWASKELQVDVNSSNNTSLIRVYNAYKRFINFIRDPTQRKDLRHIQPLLAEPGLFTARGIQLIIMEKDNEGNIQIKCPNFGVSLDRHKKCDFVFISREMRNIGQTNNKYAKYELYLHTINIPPRGGEGEIHETTVRWISSNRRYWPQIVQKRVEEYMNNCQSRYRSIYTPQEGVDSMALIPLSKAIEAAPFYPVGVIRDSYNHAVAITFRSKPGRSTLVALPIVDDGYMPIQLGLHFDWDDFNPAPIEDVITYYKKILEPLFALYPGYIIKYAVKTSLENKIVAVQLENGIYIPCKSPKDETSLANLGINVVTIDELVWTIDKELTKECGQDQELIRRSSYGDFEELYQQFRLMVSNWITDVRAGGEVRKGIEKIIFNENLPEYERRKRLFIFLSPTLLSWFYADNKRWEQPMTFLRKDCRVIDNKDSCSGTCYWNLSENGNGKCLLHVHSKTELGDHEVSTPDLFTKRIIDELVRFPNRRKQLMKKGEVSKVSSIIEPIRQGDQYIIPESSPTWTNLLRLDWTKQIPEKPVYYEEMSRDVIPEENEKTPKGELPDSLKSLLGEETLFRVKIPDAPENKPLLPFTAILGTSLSELGLDDNATTLTKENLAKYVKKTSKPIGLIDLRIDTTNPDIQFVRPMSGLFSEVIILVFLPNVYGMLVEEDGVSTVTIKKLPETIQSIWKSSPIVVVKKSTTDVINSETQIPTIIGTNPLRNTRKRRPPVAKTTELVEAKPNEQITPIVSPKIRKRPVIAKQQENINKVEGSEKIAGIPTISQKPTVANVLRSQTRKKRPQIAQNSVVALSPPVPQNQNLE
jgi:hypothetical protein